MDLTISFPQAVLGDTVEIPTLTGKSRIKIPAGIQSGKILRLKGKGITHLRRREKGDQLVRVHVYTPEKISASERKIMKELTESDNFTPPVSHGGFFSKVKEAFGY